MAFQPNRSFQRSKIVKDTNDYSDDYANDYQNNSYRDGENVNNKRPYRNRDANSYENGYTRAPYRQDNNYQEKRNFSQRPQRAYSDSERPARDFGHRDNNGRDSFFERKRERYSDDSSPRSYNNSYNNRDRNDSNDSYQRDNRNSNRRPFDRNQEDRPYRNSRNSDRFSREQRSFDRPFDKTFDRKSRDFDQKFERDDFFSVQNENTQNSFDNAPSRNDSDRSNSGNRGRQEREFNLRERNNRNFRDNNGFRDNNRESNGFRDSNRENNGFRDNNRGNNGFRDNNRDNNGFRDRGRDNDRFPRQRGRSSRTYENLLTLFDVDKELLNLLFRRAELLDGVKHDNRVSPNLEKKLRVAWEGGTAKITKDPRIARDFFNLLQQLEPIPYAYSKPNYYCLAPQFTPVQIDLDGALCSRQVRMLFALAAASGTMASFTTYLSPTIMSTIKAFNQLGGQLWWEGHDRVLSRGGSGIMHYLDKVVPVGSDELSFYLVLALTLLVPARLKLVGDGPLRFMNTQAIKNFLPRLNARLTTVIPGQDGIPVRVESAGMMPNRVELPSDLPRDFIIALVLTSCMRKDLKGEMEFVIEEHAEINCIKSELASLFATVSVPCVFEDNDNVLSIKVTIQAPVFVDDVSVDLDPMYTTCLLAMPAFAGGKAVLRGKLNEKDLYCLDFLRSTGLTVNCEENNLVSEHPGKKLCAPDLSLAPSYPMALIFSVLSALSGEEVRLPEISEKFVEDIQEDVIHGFLAQIGLKVNDDNILVKCEVETNAWFLPSSDWGLAISLLAFMRPHIMLVNPEIITSIYPMFWRVYNTLPTPTAEPAVKEEVKEEEKKNRRVIAADIFDENTEEDFDENFVENNGENFGDNVETIIENTESEENPFGENSREDELFSGKLDSQFDDEEAFSQVKHPDEEV